MSKPETREYIADCADCLRERNEGKTRVYEVTLRVVDTGHPAYSDGPTAREVDMAIRRMIQGLPMDVVPGSIHVRRVAAKEK